MKKIVFDTQSHFWTFYTSKIDLARNSTQDTLGISVEVVNESIPYNIFENVRNGMHNANPEPVTVILRTIDHSR